MSRAHREIESLLYRYAELLDAGDLDGVGRLFEHGRFGPGDGPLPLSGAQLAEENRRLVILYEDGTPRTKHVTSNVSIDVDEAEGSATSSAYFVVFQQAPGHGLEPIVSGRYRDRFERVEGRWRFAERRVYTDLVGDVSRHLRNSEVLIGSR